ncbi:MAG TPA: mucoidy inhibitor MuiA family protein [Anaeromyxobacteraceae bacterium]
MRALAIALFLTPSFTFAAADLDTASRVDAVTVYRTGARVTRVARVDVGGGDARVLLAGLPDGLDDDSIRVEGRGTAQVRLYGVTVERVTAERAMAAEARAAEARIEKLQDEDRALDDRARAAAARAKFVESLRSSYSEERAKNLAVRPVSPKEWADLVAFVDRELAAAATDAREAATARRDLARRTEAARAELEKLSAKRGATTKRVAVEIAAEKPGSVTFAVSYTVPSAGWQPIWDARLAPHDAKVELAFQGSVWQRTGEDWQDVKLTVSTAAPARGLFVPALETRWLDREAPVARHALAGAPSAAPPRAASEAKRARPSFRVAEEEEAPLEPTIVAAQEAQATVEEGLVAASFTSPRRESVDGAGQARKIALARFPLDADLTRTAAPRIDRAAFLTAKLVNGTGFPLLAGTAGVYVGDQFVGRAPLPFTPAGGELKLAFGADDRVEIDRRVLERKHDTAGLVNKDDVWSYRVRTTVKSRWGEPVKVTLLDLVPVARDGEIHVEVLDGSTKATREDPERPGVRSWELTLAPKEEKVIELRYEVRMPRGFAVAGLE